MPKTKRTWHSGAPPSVGWWPASAVKNKSAIRWFDGDYWSSVAWPENSETEAAYAAKQKYTNQHLIKWCERWWL
jgi:hypothetical protein